MWGSTLACYHKPQTTVGGTWGVNTCRCQDECKSARMRYLLIEGKAILFAIALAKWMCHAVFLQSFLIHAIFCTLLLSLQITAMFAVSFCEIKKIHLASKVSSLQPWNLGTHLNNYLHQYYMFYRTFIIGVQFITKNRNLQGWK